MSSSSNPTAVARILYKEIVPGELRKFEARLNDTPSGGGARDLRFGDYFRIEPIVRAIFPNAVTLQRRRNGQSTQVKGYSGALYWERHSKVFSKEVTFEPPTTARPSEGRIAKVHDQPALDPSSILPLKKNDKVILVFAQRNDGQVWPFFTTQSSLRTDDWDPRVAREILRCIDGTRNAGVAVIGSRDFLTGEGYCNER